MVRVCWGNAVCEAQHCELNSVDSGNLVYPRNRYVHGQKIFDIRESNPGQLDGNELGYHYPNVEWHLSGEEQAPVWVFNVTIAIAAACVPYAVQC